MPLAAEIQEALGELVGAARALLARSLGAGLGDMHEPIALEVTDVVAPMGRA